MRAALSVFGGLLIHIVLGTVYITGNISIYVASYLHSVGHDVALKDLSVILPLQVIGTTFALIIGSYLTTRFNPWMTTILGNSILVGSVFASSFIKTFYVFATVYGFIYGFGVGISYTTPMIIGWSHFPKHKGRVSGIIVSGFGFGSSIFNVISTHWINPENKSPDVECHGDKFFASDVADRFPMVLRWLSLIYLIVSLIGILLLIRPKKAIEADDYITHQKEEECPSIAAGIKTKHFWLLFLSAFCSFIPGLYIAYSYKTFGKHEINDDHFLTYVGSVSSIFNGSFRYLWGMLMDKTSFKTSYCILLLCQIGLMASLYFIATMKWLYLIWVSFLLCCEGGNLSLFPTIIARMYGKTMGSKIYGVFFYTFGLGALAGYFIQFHVVPEVGYHGLFYIMSGVTCISLLTQIIFFKEENLWSLSKKLSDSVNQ